MHRDSWSTQLACLAVVVACGGSCSLFETRRLTGPDVLHTYDLNALGDFPLPVHRVTSVRPDGTTYGSQVVRGRLVLYENQRFLRETWTRPTRNGKPSGGSEVERLTGTYHLEGSRLVLTYRTEWMDPQIWRYDSANLGNELQGTEPYLVNSLLAYYSVATYVKHR